jgi:signal transduction histidine kinase
VRRRLLLVVLATTTLVVVAFAIPLGGLVRSVARDRAISAAERDAAALAPVLALTTDPDAVRSAIERTTLGAAGRLSVVLPDGVVVGDPTPVDPDALALARGRQRSFSVEDDAGRWSYAAVVTGAGEASVLRARIPAAELDAGVRAAWLALGAVALGLVVAAAVLADRLARSLTREAVGMAATARALAAGDPAARVVPGATPELADAAGALNLLADRIDALRAAERERVADLSHRLRTPLTALRLDADRTGNAEVAAGVDRLEAAVSELVRSARRPLHESPVGARGDVCSVARDRVAFWSALAEDDGRAWSGAVPDGSIEVGLGADELGAAIDALIGNVFAHTPEGTPYRLEVVAGDGALVVVAVDDGGPGIVDPAAVLERGRTGAGSTGLGLDIARQAAEAAGGSISIGPSPLGGARVELRFPVLGRA